MLDPPPHHRSDERRNVVILVFSGVQPLDAIGPYEVFAGATEVLAAAGRPGYRLTLCSLAEQVITTESGLRLLTDPLPTAELAIDTLLLPGGDGVHAARADARLLEWVAGAAARSRRLATVCTGTFLAAQAGLLDGRTVTTHWARARRLAEEFPALNVDADPIYRRDGNVWTSAGVTAGIDLALALVEDDHGADVAQTVARWLVMFLHRPGGQTQFAAPVWTRRADRTLVRDVQSAIEASPGGDHRLATLAAAAMMSVRHFTRVFTDEVGEPPGRYVERVRVEAARRALETTSTTLEVIAASCGFGTGETMRRAFHRHLAVAPDAYRRRFRVA
ncbi:MAG: transcriptional regulator DarR [Ilumatobacteraceae bacterium]|nr:transcriptional regulator DarR [Ilumatobacteraceae bacterium]